MKKVYMFLAVAMLLSLSCSDDPVSSNAYVGNWNFIFSGTFSGSGTVEVKPDGTFSSTVTINNVTNAVSGNVNSSGAIENGKIFYAGNEIGTLAGTFQSNTGSGTWQSSAPANGTWAANK